MRSMSLSVVVAIVVAACGGSVDDTGGVTPREPERHRSEAVACVEQGVAGPAMPCETDADCGVDIPRAHCVLSGGSGYCTYEWCTQDADCAAGTICECARDGYASTCVSSAGCALDVDCPGSYCSPSFGDCGPYSGTVGYYCHTPEDECVDDADCPGGGYCWYQPAAGHWMCGATSCVG